MKCPICNGELAPKESSVRAGAERFGYQAFACGKCGEELVFEEEFEVLMKNAMNFKKELHFKKEISYAGNSLVLRLPKKLAEEYNIQKGTVVEIIPQKEGFTVKV